MAPIYKAKNFDAMKNFILSIYIESKAFESV